MKEEMDVEELLTTVKKARENENKKMQNLSKEKLDKYVEQLNEKAVTHARKNGIRIENSEDI